MLLFSDKSAHWICMESVQIPLLRQADRPWLHRHLYLADVNVDRKINITTAAVCDYLMSTSCKQRYVKSEVDIFSEAKSSATEIK